MKGRTQSNGRELLILTCSVEARVDRSYHVGQDKSVRLRDYLNSISSWINLAKENNWDLYVLENSGHINDLLEGLRFWQDENADRGQIQFFACELDTVSAKNGISQGEYNMLREAVFPQVENYEFIWKATGRTFVENVPRVTQNCVKPDLLVELTFIPYVSANSRFFGMKSEMWQQFLQPKINFLQRKDAPNNKLSYQSIEEYLTFFTLKKMHEGKRVELFEEILIHRGNSGSTDKPINNKRRRILLLFLNPIRPHLRKLLMGIIP